MAIKQELFQGGFEKKQMSNAELINKRRVINGFDDGLMQVSPLKHPWAYEIFHTMIKNTWVPQEVPMQQDVNQWDAKDVLTDKEKRVYERSLAFVSNLDGLQTNNLACNIIRHITSPEVVLAITRQTYEEALHVQSYATLVEALGLDPEQIYGKQYYVVEQACKNMAEDRHVLLGRCDRPRDDRARRSGGRVPRGAVRGDPAPRDGLARLHGPAVEGAARRRRLRRARRRGHGRGRPRPARGGPVRRRGGGRGHHPDAHRGGAPGRRSRCDGTLCGTRPGGRRADRGCGRLDPSRRRGHALRRGHDDRDHARRGRRGRVPGARPRRRLAPSHDAAHRARRSVRIRRPAARAARGSRRARRSRRRACCTGQWGRARRSPSRSSSSGALRSRPSSPPVPRARRSARSDPSSASAVVSSSRRARRSRARCGQYIEFTPPGSIFTVGGQWRAAVAADGAYEIPAAGIAPRSRGRNTYESVARAQKHCCRRRPTGLRS